jgi:uncharacterized protein
VPDEDPTGGLLTRHVDFTRALRGAGLPVSPVETLDAGRAVLAVGLGDRERVRAAYAAAAVKRPAHRPTFDRLFDLWWPVAIGDGADAGEPPPAGEPLDAADLAARRDELRERLRDVVLAGDDAAMRRLAREAVSGLGRAQPGATGRQSWFTYRVLRAMNPDTLLAGLLEEVLAGKERGGLAERSARQLLTERLHRFDELVEAEVRRRLAEDRGPQAMVTTVVQPLVEQVEFLRASREDLVALRREVAPLARRLATRLTVHRHRGRTGRLDVRRTVRAAMSTGGVPVSPVMRPRRPRRPELVVLCDLSGSVAAFAHFTVLLAVALREQFARVRIFAFVDTADEVTDVFERGADPVEAVAALARRPGLVQTDGHSDYGNAFETFVSRWPDALTPRTALLVLGDARTNYRQPGLAALRTMVRSSRRAYWLNPEPAAYWASGDSAAPRYAELLPMVECRNAAQLSDFVAGLLPG